MMEGVCNDTVFAAWGALQDVMFTMWKGLSALGWAMFVVLIAFLLINIALTAYVVFSLPNQEGKEG